MNESEYEFIMRFREDASKVLKATGREFDNVGRKVGKTDKQVDKLDKSAVKASGSIAALGTAFATFAAGIATVGIGVGKFGEFQKGLQGVATLVPGVSDGVAEFGDQLLRVSADTGTRFSDLTAGLYQTVSAFGATSDAVTQLELANKAAIGGISTTSDAISLLSAVTKGYGDSSLEALQKASDLAFTTVRLGQTTFPELARAIGRVTPVANVLGVSIEELFGAYASLTGAAGNTNEVTTLLSAAFINFLKPTTNMKEALRGLGVATGEQLIRQRGLIGSMEALKAEAEKSGLAINNLFESSEAIKFSLQATGPLAGTLAANIEEMGASAGATTDAFNTMRDSMRSALDQISSITDAFLIKIGQALEPLILGFRDVAQAANTAFQQLDPEVQKFTATSFSLTAALVPVVRILALLAPALLPIIAAVVAAVGALAVMAQAFSDAGVSATNVGRVFQEIVTVGSDLIDTLFGGADASTALSDAWNFMVEALERTLPSVEGVLDGIREVGAVLAGSFKAAESVVDDALQALTAMVNYLDSTWVGSLASAGADALSFSLVALDAVAEVVASFLGIGDTISLSFREVLASSAALFSAFVFSVKALFTALGESVDSLFDSMSVRALLIGDIIAAGFVGDLSEFTAKIEELNSLKFDPFGSFDGFGDSVIKEFEDTYASVILFSVSAGTQAGAAYQKGYNDTRRRLLMNAQRKEAIALMDAEFALGQALAAERARANKVEEGDKPTTTTDPEAAARLAALLDVKKFLADRNEAIFQADLELATRQGLTAEQIIGFNLEGIAREFAAAQAELQSSYAKAIAKTELPELRNALLTAMDQELSLLRELRDANLDYAGSAEAVAAAQYEASAAATVRYQKEREFTGSFFEGITAGWMKLRDTERSTFQQGRAFLEEGYSGLTGFISDSFTAAFDTQIQSFGDFVGVIRQGLSTMLRNWGKYFSDLALRYVADAFLRQLLGIAGGLFGGSPAGTDMMQPNAMGGLIRNAKGAAYVGGTRYLAKGGLLNGQTRFASSEGMNVGGEAGTEAVMPLGRDSMGRLGVLSVDGQATMNGGTVTLHSTTNITLPDSNSGGADPQSALILGRRIEKRMREVAVEVVRDESSSGGRSGVGGFRSLA